MSQARGAYWSLALAPSWQASGDEGCVRIMRPDGLGALQISAAHKDTAVTDDDLADFAADHLNAVARAGPVTLGAFSGIAIRFGADGIQWRQWFLRHGPVALFVTYNCAEADRAVEDADVDRMLGSLRARSDAGERGDENRASLQALGREQPLPARDDWGDLGIDPEVRSGYRLYGARSRGEAMPFFVANPIERAAELRLAPAAVFNYYVFCFADVLSSSAGESAADAASCFLRLVRDRVRTDAEGIAAIYPALQQVIDWVAERQAFFDADADIYGSFTDLAQEIETAFAVRR